MFVLTNCLFLAAVVSVVRTLDNTCDEVGEKRKEEIYIYNINLVSLGNIFLKILCVILGFI